ncbi:hypothetical protein COOONC_21206 [Cooperia oncophora]
MRADRLTTISYFEDHGKNERHSTLKLLNNERELPAVPRDEIVYRVSDDVIYAWNSICVQPLIAVALTGLIISIAFFNFAGTTVTKNLSATTRTVVDCARTIIIWAAGIPLFGQKFIPLQLIGFALLIVGMCVYNDIAFGPWYRRKVLPKMDSSHCAAR